MAVTRAEYYFDHDPGVGNGTVMTYDGNGVIAATLGTDVPIGLYDVHVRAQNAAGEWVSGPTVELAVENDVLSKAKGSGTIVPGGVTSKPGDTFPGMDGVTPATVKFLVQALVGTGGSPVGTVRFKFALGDCTVTGSNCFKVVSTGVKSLGFPGNHVAKVQGTAKVRLNGVLQAGLYHYQLKGAGREFD